MRKNLLKIGLLAVTMLATFSVIAATWIAPSLTAPNLTSYFKNKYKSGTHMPATVAANAGMALTNVVMSSPKTHDLGVWVKGGLTGLTNNNGGVLVFHLSPDGVLFPSSSQFTVAITNTAAGVAGPTNTVMYGSVALTNFEGSAYFKITYYTNLTGVVMTNDLIEGLTLGFWP